MLTTACPDELPNPHKNCVREILRALICHDNDYRRYSVELKNLQTEFKNEMSKMESACDNIRGERICPDDENIATFAQQVLAIDEVNECFSSRIRELQEKRQQTIDTARQCFLELRAEKHKLKQFHEKTIEHLKRYAIASNDPTVVLNCERDIGEMQKMFMKECSHVKRTEIELQPFFQQLQGDKFQYTEQCCCLRDYEWLPEGRTLTMVEGITQEVKEIMGPTLRKAFAQLFLHRPADVKSFLASYLMNLERNDQMMREKLDLLCNFKAA